MESTPTRLAQLAALILLAVVTVYAFQNRSRAPERTRLIDDVQLEDPSIASVLVEDDELVLVSSECGESWLSRHRDAFGPRVDEAGLRGIRCRER